MSQDLRDVSPATGLVMGGLLLFGGLAVVFVAVDWIRVDPSSIHAPRWVLGVCGAMFALPGMAALYYGVRNGLAGGPSTDRSAGERGFSVVGWLVGLAIAAGMTAVASWVAFGPGERTFSGSVGIGPVSVGGSGQSETLGRWMFGIGAVMSGLFTVWGLAYGVRRLMEPGGTDGGAGAPK